jgi:pre-mRNA-splicing factor RBM22/SLT11
LQDLPVQVRDSALEIKSDSAVPLSDANRNFQNKIVDSQMSSGLLTPYSKADFNPVIQRMARTTPHYDRNRAHICSFFVKGTCNRGLLCPFRYLHRYDLILLSELIFASCLQFRHEKPEESTDSSLSHQNIKDRYYGVNDPVANKILHRNESKEPVKPEDTSVTTLFIGNVDTRISEQDLRYILRFSNF